MRNTPAIPPLEERDDTTLIEDLCLALRDVGGLWCPEDDGRAAARIEEVKKIYALLLERRVDVKDRIDRLSEETSWRMADLLSDCLGYPNVLPYVKDKDGIRRALRCSLCGQGEFPDKLGIWMCDACLVAVRELLSSCSPMPGLVLFRTYNDSKRCNHADSDTVLFTFDDPYEFAIDNGRCDTCLTDEQERRKKL